MHRKVKTSVYTGMISMINGRMLKHGYKVTTEFNKEEMIFEIKNLNTKTGDTIYYKRFGYRKESEKDALIARAYEEYFIDMFEYGILLNNESFITVNKT
jgi:hypothetical protein